MKKFLLSLGLSLFSIIMFAQNSTIVGSVADEQGGGLPGANIYLEGTDHGTITDAHGKFTLKNVSAGEYNLMVSYIGYNNYREKITVSENQSLELQVSMNEGLTLDEVVISPVLQGQSKALNSQKNSINITNMVSNEMIEQFPDANIGDGLKRIPGINVQYDQGEARFINIRGTSPELNSLMINGQRIPSAEGEVRSVQADLIPADMVESIEVSKALTPDMEGDAIGGAINLITKNAPKDFKAKVNLGGGYGLLSKKPIFKGKFELSNRILDNKLGFVLSASGHNNNIRSDNVEAEWDEADDGNIYTEDHQIRQYYVQRLRQSYSLNLDYKLNANHTIYVKGIYNWRNDWENRYRFRKKVDYDDATGEYTGELIRQTKGGTNKDARLEDQRVQSLAISGDHVFNKLSMNWSFSMSKASEERPNERYIAYNIEDIALTSDLSDPKTPFVLANSAYNTIDANWGIEEITEEYQYTEELDKVGAINFDYLLNDGINKSVLAFGGKYRIKYKYRKNDFYEYEPTDEDAFNALSFGNQEDETNNDFVHGNYITGNFITNSYLGSLNLESSAFDKEQDPDELAGNYEAEETVAAGYAMLTQNLGTKFQFLAGARVEITDVKYQWKPADETLADGDIELDNFKENTNSYTNFLPAVHFKYEASKWTNIRFAWTNAIARPRYFDLVPFVELDGTEEIVHGNPELKPTQSMNFDLLGEHFFNNIGLVSGGFFYKNLKDVIAEQTTRDQVYNGVTYDEMVKPVNAGDATLYGFELAIQRRLNFLPGVLKNFSVYANYTYTKSELKDIKIEGREDEKLPLSGTPENVFNASLAFNSKKFDARISYNFASDFIEEYSDEAFFDRYYDKVNYLDFNADYKVNDMIKVYFFANNILNQPLRYFQGVSDRTMQVESYGIRLNLGVKLTF